MVWDIKWYRMPNYIEKVLKSCKRAEIVKYISEISRPAVSLVWFAILFNCSPKREEGGGISSFLQSEYQILPPVEEEGDCTNGIQHRGK